MNKRAILILALLAGALSVVAQDPVSMLQFSRLYPHGTAHSASMSGAFGAFSGDLSSIHINPAGIGLFNTSKFNFTPFLDLSRATSVDKASKSALLVSNLGLSFHFAPSSGNVRWINVAFNYTNMNNFNRKILQYGGMNDVSSITYAWCDQANGNAPERLEGLGYPHLAYETMLLDLRENSPDQYVTQLYNSDKVEQSRAITEKGYQGEYAISAGVNIGDKVYLGATAGTQMIRYSYYSDYRERVVSDSSLLDGFSREGIFETNGSGINFKVGVIYRILPELRLGLAIHTPTSYTLSAYNKSGIYSTFNTPPLAGDSRTKFDRNATSEYDYEMTTPWRAVFSAAVILNKLIISADYERVDYPASDVTDTYHDEYKWIRDFFKNNTRAAGNLRVGAEYRVNSFFSLRGGYAYHGSPYAKGDWNEQNHVRVYSAGLGMNWGNLHIAAAYLNKSSRDTDYFYYYQDSNGFLLSSNEIKTAFRDHEIRCSLGLNF
jgi:long-subunit fatty acid transport protein